MTPKAITFDFWSTLFTEGPEYGGIILTRRHEVLLDAASEAGVSVEVGTVMEAWRQAARDFDAAWGAGQSMAPFDRVTRMFAYLGLPFDQGHVALATKEIVDLGLEGDLIALPGVKEAVPLLAKQYVLGVVSDTGVSSGKVLREQLRRHGLLECFTGLSFSDETGTVKPNAGAFLAALDEMGAAPKEALHVGDIPRTDIAGAFAAGYPWAVLYTGHALREGEPQPTARVASHAELLPLLRDVIGRAPKAM